MHKYTLIFLFSLNLYATKLADINFQEKITRQNRELKLNGLGLRLATWFDVKVYVGALYVTKKSKNASELLNNPELKVLVLHFLRDVSADKLKTAWDEAFQKNSTTKFINKNQKNIDSLKAAMVDMKKGQILEFAMTSDLAIKTPSQSISLKSQSEFAKTFLKVFIGENPPNQELKRGLLGL